MDKAVKAIRGFMKDTEVKAEGIYRKGYADGLEDGRKVGIKDGKTEVWEEIREMADMPYEDFKRIYGDWSLIDVIRNMAVGEALELFDAYNTNHLKVNDIVKDVNGYKAIVTNIGTHIHLLYINNGKTWKAPKDADLVKIGECDRSLFTFKNL